MELLVTVAPPGLSRLQPSVPGVPLRSTPGYQLAGPSGLKTGELSVFSRSGGFRSLTVAARAPIRSPHSGAIEDTTRCA